MERLALLGLTVERLAFLGLTVERLAFLGLTVERPAFLGLTVEWPAGLRVEWLTFLGLIVERPAGLTMERPAFLGLVCRADVVFGLRIEKELGTGDRKRDVDMSAVWPEVCFRARGHRGGDWWSVPLVRHVEGPGVG